MEPKNSSYFLIYYYSLFSILSSTSLSCFEDHGKISITDKKFMCCIKHENLNKILSMLANALKKRNEFSRVRISRNAFNTILNELKDYGIIIVKPREGSVEGRGYKRYVIIYDADTIFKARQCIKSILDYNLVNLIEEKLNELRNGAAQMYFNDLSMEPQECLRSLKDVDFWLQYVHR